jgi:hypothetical protein
MHAKKNDLPNTEADYIAKEENSLHSPRFFSSLEGASKSQVFTLLLNY